VRLLAAMEKENENSAVDIDKDCVVLTACASQVKESLKTPASKESE
jgi:hypothetical protein